MTFCIIWVSAMHICVH